MRFALTWITIAGSALLLGYGCGGDDTTGGSTTTPPPAGCALPAECTTVKSECAALVDNSGQDVVGLRVGYLKLLGPPSLANGPAAVLITKGVELDREECRLLGEGTFSWILQFTWSTGMLKTGGAKVSTPEKGYCFVNETLSGVEVKPIEVDVGLENGVIEPTDGHDVTVPVYLTPAGDSYVLLPLRQARIFDGKLSEDGNCIGKHNAEGLRPEDSCVGNADTPPFIAGAKIDGFITLEDADGVEIAEIGQSLCLLLTGQQDVFEEVDGIKKCKRDANMKIEFEGDWCSTTNSAGGCKDSVKLSAEFAASAVKINGDCK